MKQTRRVKSSRRRRYPVPLLIAGALATILVFVLAAGAPSISSTDRYGQPAELPYGGSFNCSVRIDTREGGGYFASEPIIVGGSSNVWGSIFVEQDLGDAAPRTRFVRSFVLLSSDGGRVWRALSAPADVDMNWVGWVPLAREKRLPAGSLLRLALAVSAGQRLVVGISFDVDSKVVTSHIAPAKLQRLLPAPAGSPRREPTPST